MRTDNTGKVIKVPSTETQVGKNLEFAREKLILDFLF